MRQGIFLASYIFLLVFHAINIGWAELLPMKAGGGGGYQLIEQLLGTVAGDAKHALEFLAGEAAVLGAVGFQLLDHILMRHLLFVAFFLVYEELTAGAKPV